MINTNTTRYDPYYYTGRTPCLDEVTWVRKFEVYEFGNFDRYVASFYFVVKTVLAVGYGDVYPTNTGERLFAILLEVAGAIVYGYILSGVTRAVNAKKGDNTKMRTIGEWAE